MWKFLPKKVTYLLILYTLMFKIFLGWLWIYAYTNNHKFTTLMEILTGAFLSPQKSFFVIFLVKLPHLPGKSNILLPWANIAYFHILYLTNSYDIL